MSIESSNYLGNRVSERNLCTPEVHSKILFFALCFPPIGVSSGKKNTITIKTLSVQTKKQL